MISTGNFTECLTLKGRNFNIWIHYSGYIHHRFHSNISINDGTPNTSAGLFSNNSTFLVMIGNSGNYAETYFQGVKKTTSSSFSSNVVDENLINIGRSLDNTDTTTLNNLFDGKILEILIFDKKLTDSERTKVNYYLSTKWDLTGAVDSDGDGTVDSSDATPLGN